MGTKRKKSQPTSRTESDGSSEAQSSGSERDDLRGEASELAGRGNKGTVTDFDTENRSPKRRRPSARGEGSELLRACKEQRGDTESAAKEWLDRYKDSQAEAIAELLDLVVQAAGSTYPVTGDEIEEGEVDKLVSAVRQEVDQDGYIDLFKSRALKHFPANFLRLWEAIIQKCSDQDALYDHVLLESVCHLLIGFSSSDVRCLRYVGTLTACHLATALVKIIVALSVDRERADRQHAAEAKRKGSKAAQERADTFKRTSQRYHSHINELEAHINSIFQGITTNRFRDTAEEIREIVIDGLGNWAQLHPAGYLKDLYLKYIAWALSDRAPGVREAAIDAIIGMLEEPDNLTPLGEFIVRFNHRFAELPNDIHDSVAVKGVQLLTQLVKLGAVSASEVTSAYQLLLEDSGAFREAAAELVSVLIEDAGKQYMLKLQTGQRGRRKSLESYATDELQLAGLLHIIDQLRPEEIEAAEWAAVCTSLVTKVVDALFDRIQVLQNWDALTEALLDDKACEQRGEIATTDVALLLSAAVQRACGANLGLPPAVQRKGLKVKAAAAIEEHRHKMTMVMSRVLLRLLRKFQADAVKAAALAGIVRHLKLEIFSLKNDEQGLEEILKSLVSLLGKHAVPDTVQSCLLGLAKCADPDGGAPQEPGHGIFVEAVGALVDKVAAAAQELLSLSDQDLAAEVEIEVERDAECEEVFKCRSALMRLHQLLLISPAATGSASLAKSLAGLSKAALEGRPLPMWLIEDTVRSRSLVLLWQLQQQLTEPGDRIPGWSGVVTDFMEDLVVLLQRDRSPKAVIIFCLADLFEAFRPDALEGLEGAPDLRPAPGIAEAMWAAAEGLLAAAAAAVIHPTEDDSQLDHKQVGTLSAKATAVIASLARLVVHKIVPFDEVLPGRILSFLEAGDEAVAGVVRDVHQHLRKARPARMPELYLAALQSLYVRTKGSAEPLSRLSKKIASFYSPLVANAGEAVAKIIEGGITFAFRGSQPEDVPFLGALLGMVPRLPAQAAEKVGSRLDAAADSYGPDPNQAEWEAFFDLVKAVKERNARFKAPRGALKQPGTASKQQGRRISFKDAGKRQKPQPRRWTSRSEALVDGAEQRGRPSSGRAHSEDEIEDAEQECTPAKLPPRFHSKTRRGSQAMTPPSRSEPDRTPAGGEELSATLEGDDLRSASPPVLPNSAEDLPSGLFLAGSESGAEDVSEHEVGEDDEEEMPRMRPRLG